MTGYAEIFSGGELRHREQLLENLQGASLMGHDYGIFGIGSDHLYSQCADIDAYTGHHGSRVKEVGWESLAFGEHAEPMSISLPFLNYTPEQ